MQQISSQAQSHAGFNPDGRYAASGAKAHVPMRSCMVCRNKLPKYELTRLVCPLHQESTDKLQAVGVAGFAPVSDEAPESRTQQERQLQDGPSRSASEHLTLGKFVADLTQTLPGRGYYVCRNTDCRAKLNKTAKGKVCRRLDKIQGMSENAGSKRG